MVESQKMNISGQQINEQELAHWLVIRRIPGLGPRRFAALLQHEKSLSNCFSGGAPRKDFLLWCEGNGIAPFEPDWKGVEKDLSWAEQDQNQVFTCQDARYPYLLKEIAQAPPILFVKGKCEVLGQRQLAIVGTRQPSVQGRENAYQFGYALSQQGLAITSGLALGIDAASHEGAIAAGGVTIAVLGNSLESVYPAKHRQLAQSIIEQGALVSEFPIGTPPKPENFPQRNRIISGLSLGVLVVESALKSGSLITANYALDQGREIFALPGSIHNPMAKGCHQLIRQGAKCVENCEHILEELSLFSSFPAKPQPVMSVRSLVSPQVKEELPIAMKQLLAHITEVCTPIDSVVDRTGLTVTEVSSMLLALEMQGVVASVPGGYVRVGTGG
jgi:DNA processing protein